MNGKILDFASLISYLCNVLEKGSNYWIRRLKSFVCCVARAFSFKNFIYCFFNLNLNFIFMDVLVERFQRRRIVSDKSSPMLYYLR